MHDIQKRQHKNHAIAKK